MENNQITFTKIKEFDIQRYKELTDMYAPYITVTNSYADLICKIVSILGTNKPTSIQDKVIRDLLADVFDSLHEARRIIMTSKCSVAYPVIRRAYESLSLLTLCCLDPKYAEKWQKGKQIGNAEIRKELAKYPMGESEESTREIYKFFSIAAHPNRELIPQRYLGEGNEFTLGAIGFPNLPLITQYCMIHLRLWFWLTATISFHYNKNVSAVNQNHNKEYMRVANYALKIQSDLEKNFIQLIEKEREYFKNVNYSSGDEKG